MRPHRRRRPAVLIAFALAASALGLNPSPATAAECGESPTCVIVSFVSTVDGVTSPQESYTFTPAQIQALSTDAQLNQRVYNLRRKSASQGGKLDDRSFARGQRVSVQQLLGSLDPRPIGTPTYMETPNAAGVPSVLSASELGDPTSPDYPFYRNLPPAVYVTSGGALGYIRPLRDRKEDTNVSDYFQVAGALELTVHTTGRLIAPTVVSSAGTDLGTGAKTTFSVSYPDDVEREDVVNTRWDFGDGSTKGTSREAPSKSFAERGTYRVAVAVRTADGSYGRSTPLDVKVGKPPKAPTSGTGGGSGSGGGGGSIGDGGGASGGALPPPFDPFEGDVDPPGEIEDLPLEDVEPAQPVPVDDGLVPVEGFVLAGAEIVPGGSPEAIPGTQDSTAPAPATQASNRQRIATWAVAALATLLLVGIGAASETRWFRNRLRHLRRAA